MHDISRKTDADAGLGHCLGATATSDPVMDQGLSHVSHHARPAARSHRRHACPVVPRRHHSGGAAAVTDRRKRSWWGCGDARAVNDLRMIGHTVEIRGKICYSTCILYPGTPNVCISPTATLGFHGPGRSGQPLSAAQFEAWSKVMAGGCSPALQQRFVSGRSVIDDIYSMSGSQPAAFGYRTCQISWRCCWPRRRRPPRPPRPQPRQSQPPARDRRSTALLQLQPSSDRSR
ncbi:hypothetical protein SAMN04488003_101194 [Loktanella fryxellensis]|uniref:Uncharacterized protein n=1 Tax=Loktanella fryxellensis TaxID=245187 RepID=A0A1H7YIY7_9RHOB|nr:hypothetical protein SAMN04488003_101194 [Loktanella fryxellensis]